MNSISVKMPHTSQRLARVVGRTRRRMKIFSVGGPDWTVGGPVPDLQPREVLGGFYGLTPEPNLCPKKGFKWVDGP